MSIHSTHGADPLLTVAEAAAQLGTSERYPRRLVAERRIDFVKVGRHVRIRQSVVDRFLQEGEVPAMRPPR